MLSSNRWLIASAVLLPAALLALAGWLNYRQVTAEIERNGRQTAAALSEHALRTLRAHELIIEFIDHRVEGLDWKQITSSRPLFDTLVRLMHRGGGDVASVFLLGPDGKTWASSRRFAMPEISAADRDYFVALRDGAQFYISAPGRGRYDQDRFFSLARRKSSPAGGFDGLIGVSVNPEYFEQFYATLIETPRDAVGLVRADGLIVVRYPSLGEAQVRLAADGPFMTAIRANAQSGTYHANSVADGVDRIAAYHRVGEYPLYATFNVPTSAVWQAWRRAMLPYAIACLLAGAMLLIGAALVEQRVRRAAAEARGREAEEASRSKDRFVAALSHELRNPLAAISLATEVLERAPRGEAREPVGVIRRQVHQLRRMLEDLLDTSRALYGKLRLEKRRVELRAVAQAVVSDQQARAGAGVQIALEGPEAWVDADPVRLAQMLENLVENAVKYGGRRIRVAVEAEAATVRVRVSDDGQGIAKELLPRLFQPFVQGEQTLDRAQGGLGLGLALVDRLAALHGGTMSAQSEGPGAGATFLLRLPAAAPDPAAAVEASLAPLRPQRFLVVEDDADARERLEQLLRLEGHDVMAAANGAEGLAAARAFAPDAALLDIGLPGMDGYELARQLRALAGDGLVLVAVTGYGQREDRSKALAAGFDAHVTKPYTYKELTRALGGVARRKGKSEPTQQAA